MAGCVVGGLRGASKQNYWDALQTIVTLDDQAKIVAAHVRTFYFRDEASRDSGAQNFQRFLRRGHDDYGVAILPQNIAHDVRGALIRFDRQHHRHLFLLLCITPETWVSCCKRISFCGGLALVFLSGFRRAELHRDSVLSSALFCDANYFCALRGVECGRGARIRKHDVKNLALPIAATGSGEE